MFCIEKQKSIQKSCMLQINLFKKKKYIYIFKIILEKHFNLFKLYICIYYKSF